METLSKTTVIELNIISGQQLPTCKSPKKTQTYVVAWINPKQKLTTRIDTVGNQNPTWNDKFIFAISSTSINPCSTIVFEIYCVRRFRKDKRIGSVHVLLESLIGKGHGRDEEEGSTTGECMAFHVRRPGGEPQGILNIGVSRLEALPSFVGPSMAVDYRRLMGEEEEEDSYMNQKISCLALCSSSLSDFNKGLDGLGFVMVNHYL